MRIRLDVIETRLRMFIEEWFIPFRSDDFQRKLAHLLVNALHEQIYTNDNGEMVAPYQYVIRLNPTLVDELKGSNILDRLPAALEEIAAQTDMVFLRHPVLRLEPDPSFGQDDVAVQALTDIISRGNTAILSLQEPEDLRKGPSQQSISSYLIVNGERIFPLLTPVINIGRRTENHLVIEDPRVSRQHAQIRFNRGQYILFDLNSTGGTLVNGQRTHQHVLKPGDVISLAGVSMIYGEEPRPMEGDSNTTRIVKDTPPPRDEDR
jgi:pSer/pThr/pTyr-binding forkhead associated (FHA) protein